MSDEVGQFLEYKQLLQEFDELQRECEAWRLLFDGRAEADALPNGEPRHTPRTCGRYLNGLIDTEVDYKRLLEGVLRVIQEMDTHRTHPFILMSFVQGWRKALLTAAGEDPASTIYPQDISEKR